MPPALRAAPWAAVLAGSAAGGLLLMAVVGAPVLAALVPFAVALLAGSAAFALDEPAAAAVDATPTSLRRRTATRSLAALVPLGAGALGLAAVDRRLSVLPLQGLLLVLAASALLALVLASGLRRRMAAPGETAGAAVVLGLVVLALFDPLARWGVALPSSGTAAGRTTLLWAAVAVVSVAALCWTTRDLLRRGLLRGARLSRRAPGPDPGPTAGRAGRPGRSTR